VRVLSLILTAFLVVIQAQLWFGKGGFARVVQLRGEVSAQQAANEQARARNAQLSAELRDLREGLEMVEEKARLELGMVKPDEIYVQLRR
jgi:cell division protein FtsB